MIKNIINGSHGKFISYFSSLWNNFYFHWQIKDKFGYAIAAAFILIATLIPLLTTQLVKTKTIQRDIHCLALNIYHEARGEKKSGQIAVAKVTLNRVLSRRYPDTVCEVVYEKRWDRIRKRYVGAFSWTEFDEPPKLKSKAWYRAWDIAKTTYKNKDKLQLDGAVFYHAKHIKPSWARKKKPIAKIGDHIFYR
ncbi:MAG: cell wall hydrolase [Gammaproteobacteria bacterium]|nr:cell wall hydrolase [Gammaproteobacteria bacterium]